MEYFATYYLANVLHGVVVDPAPYLRHIDAFCGDAATESFYVAFPRYSALHRWAEFVWHDILGEDISDLNVDALVHDPHSHLWVEEAMRRHGQTFVPIREWWRASGRALKDLDEDAIADYYAYLMDEGPLDDVSTQVAREVFQILFLNRAFLRGFHQLIAGEVRRAREGSNKSRSWALPRARIPLWAQKAVFYRDRGRCVFCRRDLTGLVNFPSPVNFDHIVPLAHGGVNDVSNLQLLCEACNSKKGARHDRTDDQYDEWFRPLAG
jgi:hypothetical protein